VRLAIRQLLDNALKYSLPRSPITVRVGEGGVRGGQMGDGQVGNSAETIAVEVANCGAAIPPAEQARIFERFYRGASAKEQVPGSGLGLSIAARIVQAHHGELTVASGSGETVFRMTLPKGLDGGSE
jgi:signal transduction histidine kinase